MLNIYYGRESLNKDKFIFDNIEKGTILLVPDQYSLQAEKDAFFYLDTESLMDIEVLSFSRLRDRVIAETGGRTLPMIDKQGRHMLLTKIMNRCAGDLEVYGKYRRSSDFLDMANNMISELKQCGIGPEEIDGLISDMEGSSLLKTKLAEIEKIYAEYERTIEGLYTDTEDLANLFTQKIKDSSDACNAAYWIYGFDVFSPKNLEAISQLIKYSRDVNVVITYDENVPDENLFKVTGQTMDRLVKAGEDVNIRAKVMPIPEEYKRERPGALEHLEREIFSLPYKKYEGDGEGRIVTVKANDGYSEAETAAAMVNKLVREQGLRYRDILIICNDTENRGPEIRQAFDRYGIKIFTDEKRGITHSPAATFVLSLMNIISEGYRAEDVITMLRSGLTDLTRDDMDRLENYTFSYRIRGAAWKKPFTKGAAELGPEQLEELEAIRQAAMGPVMEFHENYKGESTVAGKVLALYGFLEDMGVPEKLFELTDRLDREGELEAASETSQVWNKIVGVLDQMNEIIGDERISAEDFADMIRSGLEAVEIGVLPQSADGLVMGTMQRTRAGIVKVMMVLGACDGVLPLGMKSSGLLSEMEKDKLMDMSGKRLLKTDELRMAEENMAIYRGLSKPEEMLYISCQVGGDSKENSRPSPIYDRIQKIFPDVKEREDIIKQGRADDLITSAVSSLSHLAGSLDSDPEEWQEAYAWYRYNMPSELEQIREGYLFDGRVSRVESDIMRRLYKSEGKEFMFSPTRLENFGGCPFSHFLRYGLRLQERREYTVGALEYGSVFHRCMEQLTGELGMGGAAGEVTDENSPWMTITKEECHERVNRIMDEIAEGYKEGLLHESKTEEYKLRRLRRVCEESAEMMINHVRLGKIVRMMSEVGFGRGRALEPIVVDTDAGKVYIEGIIDRMDILPGDQAKIIDYKSGGDDWQESEVKAGWKLQLMLYMKAAMQAGYTPAGSFYFYIKEPEVGVKNKGTDVEKELRRAFRMNGILVNRAETFEAIENDLGVDGKKTTEVLPSSSFYRTEEEFDEIMDQVTDRVDSMCREILDGKIDIHPKKSRKRSSFSNSGDKVKACDRCPYNSVCKFDASFPGFSYEMV